ncbi:MAG: hypothetical protein ACI86S_001322 [Paracoccaceae bacterium]|jgi:hypothetical protein
MHLSPDIPDKQRFLDPVMGNNRSIFNSIAAYAKAGVVGAAAESRPLCGLQQKPFPALVSFASIKPPRPLIKSPPPNSASVPASWLD